MDKFTENLVEGIRRFAMAGVGAVSITIEKSKEIIDNLVARGEVTAAEGQAACDDLQKKMSAQLDSFSKKLKADYENASFESLLKKCDSLTPEQKQTLIDRLNAQPEEAEPEAEEPSCECAEEADAADEACPEAEYAPCAPCDQEACDYSSSPTADTENSEGSASESPAYSECSASPEVSASVNEADEPDPAADPEAVSSEDDLP